MRKTQHALYNIGAGAAGVIAAATLRKTDPRSEMTVLGDKPEPPYSHMAIPYLPINRIGEAGTHLRHHRVMEASLAKDYSA